MEGRGNAGFGEKMQNSAQNVTLFFGRVEGVEIVEGVLYAGKPKGVRNSATIIYL